jgi:hypothetical protein
MGVAVGLFKPSSWVLGLACSVVLALGCSSQEFPPGDQNPGSAGQGSGGDGTGAGGTGVGGTFVTIVPPAADCSITSHTLTQIIGDANGDLCLFAVGATPPDPNNVLVMTGDSVVPNSDTNGWLYLQDNYPTIQFTGTYCDAALSGTLENPRMLFGCASHPVP